MPNQGRADLPNGSPVIRCDDSAARLGQLLRRLDGSPQPKDPLFGLKLLSQTAAYYTTLLDLWIMNKQPLLKDKRAYIMTKQPLLKVK